MYQRFQLMRTLLSDDGVIYVNLDDSEEHMQSRGGFLGDGITARSSLPEINHWIQKHQ